MGFEILLTVLFVLLLANFVSLDLKVSKMKKDRLNIDVVAAIVTIETAVKKLNEKLRCETQSLSDYKQRLKRLDKRIDILEEGHPDTDIDYGEVDDQSNVVCVWFEGKKYVPEDKKVEDTNTFYADNEVVAETRCCATCQFYRPDSGYSTCEFSSWLHVTKKYATMSDSACNNYEAVSSDKSDVKYICFDKKIDDLQLKIDYITLCQEQDKLRNKEIGFNKLLSSAMQSGIMSAREWREFMEDLDSDT